jgi:hypothetical protein
MSYEYCVASVGNQFIVIDDASEQVGGNFHISFRKMTEI